MKHLYFVPQSQTAYMTFSRDPCLVDLGSICYR